MGVFFGALIAGGFFFLVGRSAIRYGLLDTYPPHISFLLGFSSLLLAELVVVLSRTPFAFFHEALLLFLAAASFLEWIKDSYRKTLTKSRILPGALLYAAVFFLVLLVVPWSL